MPAQLALDAKVSVTGVLTYEMEPTARVLTPHLWVTDPSAIEVMDPAPHAVPQVVSVHALVSDRNWVTSGRRVKIRARVMARESERKLIVETGGAPLVLNSIEATYFSIGDIIEAVGWPARGIGAISLHRVTIERSKEPLAAHVESVLPLMTSVSEIRELRNADADQGFPVDVTGTIT